MSWVIERPPARLAQIEPCGGDLEHEGGWMRLSPSARLVIATFAFVCAWLVTGALDVIRALDWTMVLGGSVIVVSIAVVVATLHLWTQAGDANASQLQRRGDEGGGGPRHYWPDSPLPGGGGSDPSWWPEFERRLAFYVAERDRENRPPAVATEPRR
jgi:hypothetical protein